jgi:type II secretory pathway component PulF
MGRYRYEGTDRSGAPVSGLLDAPHLNGAIHDLGRQGVQVTAIREDASFIAPAPAPRSAAGPKMPPTVAASVAVPSARDVAVALSERDLGPQLNALRAVAQPTEIRTPFLKDGELHLLFSQLASLLNSMAPVQAFTHLAGMQRREWLRDVYQGVAARVAEGKSLADAMAVYPDVFPPGNIGQIRSAETGGYLPEACQVASDQIMVARKLRRSSWWVLIFFWGTVFGFMMLGITGQYAASWKETFNRPGLTTQMVLQDMARALLLHPMWIPIILLAIAILAGPKFFGRAQFRPLRHRLATITPGIKNWARHDANAMFLFHLRKLSETGISPFRAWNLASQSMTNVALAEQMAEPSKGSHEGTKLSDMILRAQILEEGHTQMIATGELTGQVGTAISDASRMVYHELEQARKRLIWRWGVWVVLFGVFFPALAFGFFFVQYFQGLWEAVFQGVPGFDPTVN